MKTPFLKVAVDNTLQFQLWDAVLADNPEKIINLHQSGAQLDFTHRGWTYPEAAIDEKNYKALGALLMLEPDLILNPPNPKTLKGLIADSDLGSRIIYSNKDKNISPSEDTQHPQTRNITPTLQNSLFDAICNDDPFEIIKLFHKGADFNLHMNGWPYPHACIQLESFRAFGALLVLGTDMRDRPNSDYKLGRLIYESPLCTRIYIQVKNGETLTIHHNKKADGLTSAP